MLMDGDLFVKKRIPISTLEYNSIEAPSRSNGLCNLKNYLRTKLTTNYAIVAITKAFKNRKNESEYLKYTFPAGFAVDGALEQNQSPSRKYKPSRGPILVFKFSICSKFLLPSFIPLL